MGNKKVRVCHLSSVHPRYDTRILRRQCVSLANNGYEVWFVVNDDKPDEVYEGVTIKSTGHSYRGNRFIRMISGVNDVYKAGLMIDADVYQLHDPELLSIALKLKKRGKTVIFDSHECYPLQIKEKKYLSRVLSKLIAFFYFKYESYITNRIDAVIAVSESDPKYSFINRSNKLIYINNYPRISEVQEIDYENSEDNRNICYAGAITYARGTLQMAEAAKKAKVTLHLAGVFENDELQNRVMSMEKSGSIVYHGYLGKSDLREFYMKCSIGLCILLPIGQYDKMGNLSTKVYEYMGMGMPFIISDFSFNRSFIEKYPAGLLVDPENTDELADKINYLINHPEEAKRMGRIGRRAFEEEYNWSICEKELIMLYETF